MIYQATPAQKIAQATTILVLDHPFFGYPVAQLDIIEDPTCETAWMNGKQIGWNPSWIETLDQEETTGVLAHEVLHGMLGHPWRRGERSHPEWNEDCVAGETLITMGDGSLRRMDQIRAGEYVASPFGPSQVYDVINPGTKDVLELSWNLGNENSGVLTCTPEHKIFTEKGFTCAQHLANTSQGRVLQTPGIEGVCSPPLSNHEHAGAIQRDRGGLRGHFRVLAETGTTRPARENQPQTGQPGKPGNAFPYTMGLPGSPGGRRGYNLHRAQGGVFSTPYDSSQHLMAFEATPLYAGVHGNTFDQQLGTQVLAPARHRVSNGQTIRGAIALLNNQERISRISPILYRPAETLTPSPFYSNTEHVSDLADSQGAKPTGRFEIRKRNGPVRVYDLTTEHHMYWANGLLVHNCDKALNEELRRCGFKLPVSAFYPKGEECGKSAEWIYGRRGDKDPGEEPGGNGGGGQGPDPGGCGEVRDCPEEEAQEAQAEMEMITLGAAQAAMAQGKLPGFAKSIVREIRRTKVDFASALAKWIQQKSRTGYNWSKPNRRYIGTGFYMPSPGKPSMGTLVVALDNSGSISAEVVSEFLGHIQGIMDQCKPTALHVVVCDTRIQSEHEFQAGDEIAVPVAPGGGTEFKPVFEWVNQQGIDPVGLVYLTDLCLYGGWPDAPGFPVLWASTRAGKPPFGDVLLVND